MSFLGIGGGAFVLALSLYHKWSSNTWAPPRVGRACLGLRIAQGWQRRLYMVLFITFSIAMPPPFRFGERQLLFQRPGEAWRPAPHATRA